MAWYRCDKHKGCSVIWTTEDWCPMCTLEGERDIIKHKLTSANDKLAEIAEAEEAERERLAVADEPTGHGFGWALQQMRAGLVVRRKCWDAGMNGVRLTLHPPTIRDAGLGLAFIADFATANLIATDWIIDPAGDTP